MYKALVYLIGSTTDASLFIRHMDGVVIMLLIYVDDIIITSNRDLTLSNLVVDLGRLLQ